MRSRESGSTLLENLLAIAIVSLCMTFILASLSASGRGTALIHERTVAENLARQQMELLKAAPFSESGDYSGAMVATPEDYAITWAVSHWNGSAFQEAPSTAGLQTITVTVSLARSGQALTTLEDYKTDREG
ncbi:MAG: PulJ/GspJ family protein [Anaerolineae bacterium]